MTGNAATERDGTTAPPTPIGPADATAQEAIAPSAQEPIAPDPSRQYDRPLDRRGFFSDTPDKGLFLFVALLGFGLILAIKLGKISHFWAHSIEVSDSLMAAACAVVLLVLYTFFAWQVSFFRLHTDRLGDNCYYLGFVFTLASLAAALVEIELYAGDRGAVLERLIGSFGVALLSTILGILLRVFFMQMRREVEDLEEDLRHDLQQRAQLLRDQLHQAVIDLESFRLRTRQVLEERLHDTTETFSAAVNAQTQAVQRTVDDLAQRARDAFASVLAAAGDLGSATQQVGKAATDLARRFDSIEIPADLIAGPARTLRERTDALAGSVERLLEAAERLMPVSSKLESSLAEVAEGTQAIRHIVEAIEPVTAAVTRFEQSLGRQAETLSGLVRQTEAEVGAMREHREAILRDLATSREALGRTQETLTEIVRVIADRLGG